MHFKKMTHYSLQHFFFAIAESLVPTGSFLQFHRSSFRFEARTLFALPDGRPAHMLPGLIFIYSLGPCLGVLNYGAEDCPKDCGGTNKLAINNKRILWCRIWQLRTIPGKNKFPLLTASAALLTFWQKNEDVCVCVQNRR